MKLKAGQVKNFADQYDFQAALIRTLAVVGLTVAVFLSFSKKTVHNPRPELNNKIDLECPSCKHHNDLDSVFCIMCGAKLSKGDG